MIIFSLFIAGAVIGSFLNVCIHRLPKEESVVFPPSTCPHCKHRLAAPDLIPILSFLWLRAHCRYCRAKISWRYPLVELFTAVSFLATGLFFTNLLSIITTLVFLSVLIVIFLADLENFIVPDEAILVGSVVALGSAWLNHTFVSSLLAAALGGLFFLFIVVVGKIIYRKEVMGFGDVKLTVMLGLFLGGIAQLIVALYLAFIIGSVVGVLLIVLRIKQKDDFIPFAPSLITGALPLYFFASPILNWCQGFLHIG